MTAKAKSRKSSPKRPSRKNRGKNTPPVVRAEPVFDRATSAVPATMRSCNASSSPTQPSGPTALPEKATSFLFKFSNTTAPASTTIPIPTAIPHRDMRFMVLPVKDSTNITCRAQRGMRLDKRRDTFQHRKKYRMTAAATTTPTPQEMASDTRDEVTS